MARRKEEQTELGFSGPVVESVEKYQFDYEPIQGYPELRWAGKRPFRSTQYYPAQLKEQHGEPVDGWLNRIYWGDNLQVMSHLLKEFRGKIKLIYIDPPFDSKADYKKTITLRGKGIENDYTAFEEKQYSDIWTNDEYLQFMYERLILMRELLSDDGSIYVHCDWRVNSYLRLIMDDVFGTKCFQGHIVWRSMTPSGFKGKTSLGKSHDDILYYSKSASRFIYNPQKIPYDEKYLKERFNKVDENGKNFKDEKIGTGTSQETIERLKQEGRIYITSTGTLRIKHFLEEADGYYMDDVWVDIFHENSQSSNRTGYPTQKPEALLQRIMKASSNEGDIVFDCFMGSGTTQAVAMRLGRRFIGADINLGAIQTTTERLIRVTSQIKGQKQPDQGTIEEFSEEIPFVAEASDKYYTGFSVYNVNYYDVFRNPLEARDLLLQALEIQPLPAGSLFDGEKDGRLVKIMPINRIATKADLGDLVNGFDYKLFEKRREENPSKSVENILLICMGHEPDLAAQLGLDTGFKMDVQVVDILKDKSKLEFKRDSAAKTIRNDNKLIIENFYPMNLLQKLSLMEDDVENWRELVESIMIDWDYDGHTLKPAIVDLPGKNDLVKGEYLIPDEVGIIRIKITDLLSESLEVEV